MRQIAALLVLWLLVSVAGAVLEGLFWLALVGGLLFLGTAVYGALARRGSP